MKVGKIELLILYKGAALVNLTICPTVLKNLHKSEVEEEYKRMYLLIIEFQFILNSL